MVNAQEVIARALALSEAATDGPWQVTQATEHSDVVVAAQAIDADLAEPKFVATTGDPHYDGTMADAEFIAAARTLLPALARALGAVLVLADLADSGTGAYRRVVHTAQIDRAITDALSEVTP